MSDIFYQGKIFIRSLELSFDREAAASQGIMNVHNASTHKDRWKDLPYAGWSKKQLDNPDNLLLNRLEEDIVISSLVEFVDEFSYNMFCLKHIYYDMEGGMECLRKSFLN